MDISTNYTMPSFAAISSSQQQPPPPPPPQDGELSGYLAEAQGSAEAKSFMQSFMEMNESDEFDVASLLESAPESLTAYAEEQGVDLANMLQGAHEHHQAQGGKIPPPNGNMPPQGGNSDSLSAQSYSSIAQLGSNESDLLESLMSSLSISVSA